MSIEINLGERFGKITLGHEKSLSNTLTDLSKDTDRIRGTIEKLHDFPNTVKKPHGDLLARVTVAHSWQSLSQSMLEGYASIKYELSVCEDGTLVEEIKKRPLKHGTIKMMGLGKTNLEDISRVVDPKNLPQWLNTPEGKNKIRNSIKALFYPTP